MERIPVVLVDGVRKPLPEGDTVKGLVRPDEVKQIVTGEYVTPAELAEALANWKCPCKFCTKGLL